MAQNESIPAELNLAEHVEAAIRQPGTAINYKQAYEDLYHSIVAHLDQEEEFLETLWDVAFGAGRIDGALAMARAHERRSEDGRGNPNSADR